MDASQTADQRADRWRHARQSSLSQPLRRTLCAREFVSVAPRRNQHRKRPILPVARSSATRKAIPLGDLKDAAMDIVFKVIPPLTHEQRLRRRASRGWNTQRRLE